MEVDEDPAEAKKDNQDEKTEVMFWLQCVFPEPIVHEIMIPDVKV